MPSISRIMNVVANLDPCSSDEISCAVQALIDNSNFELVDSGTFYNLHKTTPSVETIKYFCIGEGNRERVLFKEKVCFEDGIVFTCNDYCRMGLQLYFSNRTEMLAYLHQAEDVGFKKLDYGHHIFCFIDDTNWTLHPDAGNKNVIVLKWE